MGGYGQRFARAVRLGLVAAAVVALAGPAAAQGSEARPASAAGPNIGLPGTGTVGRNAVDTSQGGVGGTGLGKVPPSDTTGTGQSVSGPAGQGIPGSTAGTSVK